MSNKILTKNGVENTNIDGARGEYFNSGGRSGIVKGILNEGAFSVNASNSIYFDTCELRICGHRILIDEPIYFTFANRPSVNITYSLVAQIIVSDNGNVEFSIFYQNSNTGLIQEPLFAKTKGTGKYQIELGRFTLCSDGAISDVKRTIKVIANDFDNIETELKEIKQDVDSIFEKNQEQDYKLALTLLTSKQNLTEQQKSQVRQNLGVPALNMQGSYDDVKKQIINELAISSPNILTNGDFNINQFGRNEFKVSRSWYSSYDNAVDGWFLYGVAGARFDAKTNTLIGQTWILQKLYDFEELLGKEVTISTRITQLGVNAGAHLVIRKYYADGSSVEILDKPIGSNSGVFDISGIIPEDDVLKTKYISVIFYQQAEAVTKIDYIKLEYGSNVTPYTPNSMDKEFVNCQVLKGGISSSYSNPNFIINSDFRVNQRGQSIYTSNGAGVNQRIYGPDRLNIFNGAVVNMLESGGIGVTLSNQYAGIRYRLEEKDYKILAGKTVTASIKIRNINISRLNSGLYIYGNDSNLDSVYINDIGIFRVTTTLPEELTDLDIRLITYASGTKVDKFEIEYIKLEIGNVATLNVSRPYAEELALCQRYYYKWIGPNNFGNVGNVLFYNTTMARTNITLPMVMRSNPTFSQSGNFWVVTKEGRKSIESWGTQGFTGNNIVITVITESVAEIYSMGILQRNDDRNAYLEFDAEIY